MQTVVHPPTFRRLDSRAVKPSGWLRNQLETQAAGLSGHLDTFWPDVKNSRWIGGDAEGWERMPYWLDGFIPLAWLLGDDAMKDRATRYMGYIVDHQAADGWLSPDSAGPRKHYDLWASFLMLKVLVEYHGFTRDERVEGVVYKSLKAIKHHINTHTLFNWGQTRWFEALISIWWLYERRPERWMLDLATTLRSQGFDWMAFFDRWPYTLPDAHGSWSQMSHVVNNAMMLKGGALLWRLTGDPSHLDASERMVGLLDRHHGMVTGVFSGDECLAGTNPVRGTELCAVAEYMYSLEHLIQLTGQAHWGDRLERIAFNALPAAFSPDMWTHQYDQQVNQVQCSTQEEPVFGTNNGQAHLFGLEPHYGCCTANLSQPWPKLALNAWMRSADGLVAAVYVPMEITVDIGGVPVHVTVETQYPFRETVHLTVATEAPVDFTLWLRIPEWAEDASLSVGGTSQPIAGGQFYPLHRTWSGKTALTLHFPMKAQLVARPGNLYALVRGPLVYALPVEERWVRINEGLPGHEPPHCDYEVYPTSAWNMGLALDPRRLEQQVRFEERPMGELPFSPAGAPIVARVKGKRVDWELQSGSASPIPRLNWVADATEELTLIPYGCTNLRLTEMPLV